MLYIPPVGSSMDGFIIREGFSELVKRLEQQVEQYGIVNILIAGSSCSGKTTLANFLENYYAQTYRVTRINQDDYFRNLKDMVRSVNGFYMPDSLFSFHYMELREDVKKLLEDGQTVIPEYDIVNNRRISKTKLVNRGQIQIFEGLHTIRILENLPVAIKVFVDTDESICLNRKIERDTSKYHVNTKRVIAKWEDVVQPMYERFVKPQKAQADIIIKTKRGEKDVC